MSFGKRVSIALVATIVTFGGLSLSGPNAYLAGAAFAQEISKEHLTASKRAINASRSTRQLDEILPRLAANFKSELIRNNPDQEAQISLIVDEAAISLASRRGDLENEAAQIFARVFTIDELKAIAEFYESDAGKKFLEQSPLVLREIQRASQVWGNGMQRDLGEAVQKKLVEAGLR